MLRSLLLLAASAVVAAAQTSSLGVQVKAPAGWRTVNGAGFQVLLQNGGDLSTKAPAGARIQIRSSDIYNNPGAWGKAALPAPGGRSTRIRENPAQVLVGAERRPGLLVGIEETSGASVTATRYVILALGGGRSAVIIMDAPAAAFDSYKPIFDAALKSVTFPK